MSKKKPLSPYVDVLISDNFCSSCQSILTQLHTFIPAKNWHIAYKNTKDLTLLCSNPVQNRSHSEALSSRFNTLVSKKTQSKSMVIDGNFLAISSISQSQNFTVLICANDFQLTTQECMKFEGLLSVFSNLICNQLENEILIYQQKYRNKKLLNQSYTDSLTQLLNHRAWSKLLYEEEQRAKHTGIPMAVFIMDLDKLKVTNDKQGHHAGDVLIVEAANCLRDVCRDKDIIARLGGDEFGYLATACDEACAQSQLKNLQQRLKESAIEASIGYCVMIGEFSLQEAMTIADKNMYSIKKIKANHCEQIT